MTNLITLLVATAVGIASCIPVPGGTEPVQQTPEVKLEGKTIAFIGDSIAYGTNFEGGYGKIIGEQENMLVTNTSRGGAAIAHGVKWSADGDSVRPSIIDMAEELEGGYDYIIVEGGLNDFWNHTPIGALTADFNGGYDDTTFAGALETIFQDIKENHPESKAGFVILHDPFTYDAEPDFAPYYEMIKAACDKWSVSYLDLYAANNKDTGVNVRDEWTKMQYFGSDDRPQGDGTHPNELGYQIIYVEPMVKWLKTL